MLPTAALIVILLAAGWLLFVAAMCLVRPESARQGLASMGSDWRWQLGEHLPRALVGLALVVRAPATSTPALLQVAGWFLVASSALILLLPMRWHNRFARWWADRIPLPVYRLLAVPTAGLAAGLVWLAW